MEVGKNIRKTLLVVRITVPCMKCQGNKLEWVRPVTCNHLCHCYYLVNLNISCLTDSKRPLGAGAYAVVYSGSLLKQIDNGEKKEVLAAIKMVKSNAGDEYLRAILKEIKTMAFVGSHPHIVELLACCTQNFQAGKILKKRKKFCNQIDHPLIRFVLFPTELLVITELCPNGNLAIFLKEHKNVFVNFVAKGQISRDEIMKNCKTYCIFRTYRQQIRILYN